MRASWALFVPSLCVGIHAFGPSPVGDAAQHVLGSLNVSGQSYTCNNGKNTRDAIELSTEAHVQNVSATPSLECGPQSSEPNCDCTCSNGIQFNQPLSLGSPRSRISDDCQTERGECLLREQQLANDFNRLKLSYTMKEQQIAAEHNELARLLNIQASLSLLNDYSTPRTKKLESASDFDQFKISYMMKEQQHLETERDLQRQVDTCKSNTWRYEGCYRDSERRVLSLMSEAADMTREKCAATCTKYKYYGVEFARYCFCGNSFEAPTEQIAESNCNTKCVGSSDMCGGGWALSMHAKEV